MIAVSPIPLFALLLLALFKSFFFFLTTTNLCATRLTSQASHFFFVSVVLFVFVVNAVLVARIACTIAFKR